MAFQNGLWTRLEFEGTPVYIRGDKPDWFVPNEAGDKILREVFRGGGNGLDLQTRLFLARLPDEPVRIMVAAAKPRAAELAGRVGDGIVSTAPARRLLERFDDAGGRGKPCYREATVCWARTDAEARRIAHRWWPNAALAGELVQELPLPRHFAQAAATVREEDVAQVVVCAARPEPHVAALRAFVDAGFDHVYVHQVGPEQEGFLRFYAEHVLPQLA